MHSLADKILVRVTCYWILALFVLVGSIQAGQSKESRKVHGGPDKVKVGAYILSIHDVDFHNREYTLRFWVWMRYRDYNFHFEKYLDIPNAKTIEKTDTLSETEFDTVNGVIDTTYLATLKMKAIMKEDWDVHNFPFDREKLMVQIENTKYETDSLVFEKDSSGMLNDSLTLLGWETPIVTPTVDEHPYPTSFGEKGKSSVYSRYNINLTITRKTWELFWKIYLGMYVAFLIAFVGFFISPEEADTRFEIPIGGIFAVVGNKYIIEPLLPDGSAFTLVDQLHLITLGFILATMVCSIVSVNIQRLSDAEHGEKLRSTLDARKVDTWAASILGSLYILINGAMIWHAQIPR